MRWVDPHYFLTAPQIRRKFGAIRFFPSSDQRTWVL
jgi:hypothetical protein